MIDPRCKHEVDVEFGVKCADYGPIKREDSRVISQPAPNKSKNDLNKTESGREND